MVANAITKREEPVTNSIDHHRRSVQQAFERALLLADSRQLSFRDFEQGLWSALLALGRALSLLYLARAAVRPRPGTYKRGMVRFVMNGETRTTDFGTLFGKVPFTRPIARPMGAPRAAWDCLWTGSWACAPGSASVSCWR